MFLQETLQRFFDKSPIFFKVWRTFWGVVVLACGIPLMLKQFDVELPPELSWLSNKFITGVGTGALFMSKLAIKNQITAQTETGSAIKMQDEKKLPYTTMKDAKEVAEIVPAPPIVTDVPENTGEVNG